MSDFVYFYFQEENILQIGSNPNFQNYNYKSQNIHLNNAQYLFFFKRIFSTTILSNMKNRPLIGPEKYSLLLNKTKKSRNPSILQGLRDFERPVKYYSLI